DGDEPGRRPRVTLGPGRVARAGDVAEGRTAREHRSARREHPVDGEKGGPAPACRVGEPRDALEDRPEAPDARDDERRVGDRTDRDDEADVLAPDSLAQHEDVLRADRDDEPEAHEQAREDRPARHQAPSRGGGGTRTRYCTTPPR